jgi:hypothetical protein
LLFNFTFAQTSECAINYIPFKNKEKVTYQIYYNWTAVWVKAGEVFFKVNDTVFINKPAFHFYSYGSTYPKYDWIFKVRDTYEAYSDKKTLKPYRFKRKVNEGSTYIYNDYLFNYKKQVVYTFSVYGDEPLKKDTVPFTPCSFDVLSMVYYARCIDYSKYKAGDTIPISMFLDENLYHTYIRYLGKEVIKAKDGIKYRTIKFKPLLIEGTIFKGGEGMTVWVTDDKNKIPVLIETPILVGNIKAYLINTENLKYPQDAIIP